MLSTYPACFIKEDNGYSVIFPDLNYLATCGDTLDGASAMAIDCLAGYLYSCKIDGEKIPFPSSINEISAAYVARELEVESTESFVNMVTVDVEEYAKNTLRSLSRKLLQSHPGSMIVLYLPESISRRCCRSPYALGSEYKRHVIT